MLKKLKQLISGDEAAKVKAGSVRSDDERQSVSEQARSSLSAIELKTIADEHFKNHDWEQAGIYYKQSLAIDSTQFEVYKNLGVTHYYRRQLTQAINCYDEALAIKSDYPEALSNRGLALNDMGRFEEALSSLDQATSLKPNMAFAYNNRGIALKNLNRPDEAIKSYDRAIHLKPDFPEAYNNRGLLLKKYGRLSEALEDFAVALKLLPHRPPFFAYGNWLEIRRSMCDWADYADDLAHLEAHIRGGNNPAEPLVALWHLQSAELLKIATTAFTHTRFHSNHALPFATKYAKHKKIRIGYFSGEFFNHAVSFLTAELFEKHDKSRFELIAFSFSEVKDEMTRRLENAFDEFVNVSKCPDKEVVLMARSREIDIAIDLSGYSGGSRTHIFAMRVAPVQINYLAFPGTMGADYLDYIIADPTVVPSTHQKYYTEKVVYLPSFQANDTRREISDRLFTRQELGLPPAGFVFCCFNNITKITPFVFDSWMRILKQVEGSVLWLLDENSTVVNNLKIEALNRGIDSNRLVFAKKLPLAEYLGRYRMADLFLDTLPYNAGTTASDALWAGLPVLTQIGETFAGRMAASLLNAIHLPELITQTPQEYEVLAVALATNPERLAKIKQKLVENRLTTPLFDIDYFTRNLEDAYTQIYERYHAGLPPDYIYSKDVK